MVSVLLLAQLVMAAIQVSGEVDCPTPALVEKELSRFFPASNVKEDSTRRLMLTRSGPLGIHVELRETHGLRLASKTIPVSSSCQEVASTIAVMAAAWEAQLLPGEIPTLEMAPKLERSPEPLGHANRELALGMAALLPEGSSGMAFLGQVDASMGAQEKGLAARMGFSASSLTGRPLGEGRAHWQRLSLGLGARYRVNLDVASLDLIGEVLASAVQIGGDGFVLNRSHWTLDAGAGLVLRVLFSRNRVRPWVEVGSAGWLRPLSAEVSGLSALVRIPQVELRCAVGLSVASL